jgi:hypothetical protein
MCLLQFGKKYPFNKIWIIYKEDVTIQSNIGIETNVVGVVAVQSSVLSIYMYNDFREQYFSKQLPRVDHNL